jgi:hypothetical protein
VVYYILRTIATHAHCYAFLQSAVLTPVSVDPQYGTLLILRARAVLYFLLNAASEETLPNSQESEMKSDSLHYRVSCSEAEGILNSWRENF